MLDHQALDYSETEYEMILYSLHIQHPVPTAAITHIWKKMYEEYLETKSDTIFPFYFDSYGTHYHLSANVGGKWSVYFTTKSDSANLSKSTTTGRSHCVTAKLSTAYFSSAAPSGNAKRCSDHFGEQSVNSSFESLVSSFGSTCVGAAQFCPSGPGLDQVPQEALKNWKKGSAAF